MAETVDHPAHYGGADNPYEAIKVIEAWGLGFCLGNAVKYIARAGKKSDLLEDLRKARWYLDRQIKVLGEAESFVKGRVCQLCQGAGQFMEQSSIAASSVKSCAMCKGTGRLFDQPKEIVR